MNSLRALLVAIAVLFGAVSAQAQAVSGQGTWETTLQARDIGNTGTTNAFYDTALNITWLRDANMNGLMDWNTAMSWASSLTVGNIGGWRLPTTNSSAWNSDCWAYPSGQANCSAPVLAATGEMPHLFYASLGNKTVYDSNGNGPQPGAGLVNVANFVNLNYTYWSGTEIYSNSGAWVFATGWGENYPYSNKDGAFLAMAVHNGDIGTVVANVPEPETYAMLVAGLGVIGAVARRRQSDKALVIKS